MAGFETKKYLFKKFAKGINCEIGLRCRSSGFKQVGGEGTRGGTVPFNQVSILPGMTLERFAEVFNVKTES